MVVGDFGAVADLGGQNGVRHSHPTDLRRRSRQSRNRPFHIGGQIPAVGAGIGAELLFIQCLEIVQGLLGRVAKLPVGIPLEGCQVIEAGGFSDFSFCSTVWTRAGWPLQASATAWAAAFSAHFSPAAEKPPQSRTGV